MTLFFTKKQQKSRHRFSFTSTKKREENMFPCGKTKHQYWQPFNKNVSYEYVY